MDVFDPDDRFAPFTPERAWYDSTYRKTLEAMQPEDFAQVMRDTIYALFDGPYLTWAEVRPPTEEPDTYVQRVLQFLSEVEAHA